LDFLGRARKMLRGMTPPEPPRPQYYNVTCPEGHPLRGQRTEGYQAIRCPTCGEGIFVLPRSPLPDPPAPSTLRPRRRKPAPTPVPDDAPILLAEAPPQEELEEVVWLDPEPGVGDDEGAEADEAAVEPGQAEEIRIEAEPEPGAPPPDPEIPPEYLAPPPRQPDRPAPAAPRARPRPAPGRRRPEPAVAEAAGPRMVPEGRFIAVPEPAGPGAWVGRHRVALVVVGALALAAITVAYRVWKQRLENLPQVAESSWDAGREALEEGKFDEAKHELAVAADAFARLGIDDERRTLSRQLADEAALLADRCRLQPDELIEEAASANPAEWPSRFDAVYRGRSIILDTTISETPETSAGRRYEVDFRIYAGRGPIASREGVIDLEGFALLRSLKPRRGQPVVFGGRIDDLTFKDGLWHLKLAPDSGVVMTHQDGLKHADWDPKQTASAKPSGAKEVGP
jgi:hypothetical protein